jgi:hypothetical protein
MIQAASPGRNQKDKADRIIEITRMITSGSSSSIFTLLIFISLLLEAGRLQREVTLDLSTVRAELKVDVVPVTDADVRQVTHFFNVTEHGLTRVVTLCVDHHDSIALTLLTATHFFSLPDCYDDQRDADDGVLITSIDEISPRDEHCYS